VCYNALHSVALLTSNPTTAKCCSVLQYVAVCCSVLQRVAVCGTRNHETDYPFNPNTLSLNPTTAICCSVLQYVAVCCSVLQYVGLLTTKPTTPSIITPCLLKPAPQHLHKYQETELQFDGTNLVTKTSRMSLGRVSVVRALDSTATVGVKGSVCVQVCVCVCVCIVCHEQQAYCMLLGRVSVVRVLHSTTTIEVKGSVCVSMWLCSMSVVRALDSTATVGVKGSLYVQVCVCVCVCVVCHERQQHAVRLPL